MAEAHSRAVRIPASLAAARAERQAAESQRPVPATDEQLLKQLRSGQIDALEQLYDRYSTLVYSVALRVLHDQGLAEDMTQEVFLRLWRRPRMYDPSRGRFVSWLMSVTRNRSIDEQRRRARRQREEDGDGEAIESLQSADRFDDPAAVAALGDERAAVRRAVEQLPAAQRRVIELAYFAGLTQAEIAEQTSTPIGTVKTRVRLAMRKLRDALEQMRPLSTGEAAGPGR